jgi:hypothetical protein
MAAIVPLLSKWYLPHQDACNSCSHLVEAEMNTDAAASLLTSLDHRTLVITNPCFSDHPHTICGSFVVLGEVRPARWLFHESA